MATVPALTSVMSSAQPLPAILAVGLSVTIPRDAPWGPSLSSTIWWACCVPVMVLLLRYDLYQPASGLPTRSARGCLPRACPYHGLPVGPLLASCLRAHSALGSHFALGSPPKLQGLPRLDSKLPTCPGPWAVGQGKPPCGPARPLQEESAGPPQQLRSAQAHQRPEPGTATDRPDCPVGWPCKRRWAGGVLARPWVLPSRPWSLWDSCTIDKIGSQSFQRAGLGLAASFRD